jgi:hypothetical protein
LKREPRFVTLDGRAIETSSREWLLICLARHICRMPTKVVRHQFLAQLKWAPEARAEVEGLIHTEWNRMHPKNMQPVEAPAHEHA